jgi:hypothetical protein
MTGNLARRGFGERIDIGAAGATATPEALDRLARYEFARFGCKEKEVSASRQSR